MASAVVVSGGFIKVLDDMKEWKSSTPVEVKKCKELVLFCLSEDKNIILEQGKEILVGDLGQTVEDNIYATCPDSPDKECHSAPSDAICKTNETSRRTQCLSSASEPLKSTEIYVSSKNTIRKKLTRIKHEL